MYWAPPNKGQPGQEPSSDATYTFAYQRPPRPRALRIYECHVGMSSHVRTGFSSSLHASTCTASMQYGALCNGMLINMLICPTCSCHAHAQDMYEHHVGVGNRMLWMSQRSLCHAGKF